MKPRYTSPGRREARRITADASNWWHLVPAIGPRNLTRRYRRALRAILRTAPKLASDATEHQAQKAFERIALRFSTVLGGVEHLTLATKILNAMPARGGAS